MEESVFQSIMARQRQILAKIEHVQEPPKLQISNYLLAPIKLLRRAPLIGNLFVQKDSHTNEDEIQGDKRRR